MASIILYLELPFQYQNHENIHSYFLPVHLFDYFHCNYSVHQGFILVSIMTKGSTLLSSVIPWLCLGILLCFLDLSFSLSGAISTLSIFCGFVVYLFSMTVNLSYYFTQFSKIKYLQTFTFLKKRVRG